MPELPSETTPLAGGDGGENGGGGGGGAGRKANSLTQSLEAVLGDNPAVLGAARCCVMLLVVPVLLFAAWSIWTLSTTGGVLDSPCAEGAAWWAPGNLWVWMLVAVVILLLDPVASALLTVIYMSIVLAGQVISEDKAKAAGESIQLGYRVTSFAVNLALAIWGVLVWASISPACEALCTSGDLWWLLTEFRVYVVFVALKSLVLGFFAVQLALGGQGVGEHAE